MKQIALGIQQINAILLVIENSAKKVVATK